MRNDLRDPSAPARAWITGASSGIGAAFARALVRRGYEPVLVARREERLRELAEELRAQGAPHVEVRVADLCDVEQLESLARELEADERLELLVNNAGRMGTGSLAERTFEDERGQIRLMVEAPLCLTRAALRGMQRRGCGAILQISSIAALVPYPGMATYGACKAFLSSMTLALARELGAGATRLCVVCPGATRTELFERAGLATPAGAVEPELVAERALEALAHGELLCLPGEGQRDRLLRRLVPGALRPRLYGLAQRLLRP